MFLRNGATVLETAWIEYSVDGSNSSGSMVQTQPINATPEQLTAMGVIVVEDDPPPLPPIRTFIEYGEFRLRWTDEEKYNLYKAQQTYWQINDWVNLAAAQNGVSLVSADAAAAKAMMVALHVLTQERADVIFAL